MDDSIINLKDLFIEHKKDLDRKKIEEEQLIEKVREDNSTFNSLLSELKKIKKPNITIDEMPETSIVELQEYSKPKITEPSNLVSKTVSVISEQIPVVDTQQSKELEQLRQDFDRLQRLIMRMPTNTQYVGQAGGGELNLLKPVHTVSDYNILGAGGKDLILCDTSENDIIITLPEASKNNGFIAHVKKMHRNHQLYIRGYNSTQLIDEQVQVVIGTVYVTLQLACDGSNWYIV